MSLPQVQSDHHKYNDELEAMDSGDKILLVSEPATRELSKFLEHRMDVIRGERLVALHNIAVGIMDRFAFDYGSSIELNLLRERVNKHPNEWGDEPTHDIRNEAAWGDIIETVAANW